MTEKLDKGEPYLSWSPFHSGLWWSSGREKEEALLPSASSPYLTLSLFTVSKMTEKLDKGEPYRTSHGHHVLYSPGEKVRGSVRTKSLSL